MSNNPTLHPTLQWTHFEEIDSTNDYLLAADQAPNQLVSADRQTHGRGRRQKQWIDEGDSLLFSLSTAFEPSVNLSAWPIQVAMTLAQQLSPLSNQLLKIKWPNDLYCLTADNQWGKCAGILVESTIGQQGKMVTGIGINIAPLHQNIEADYPIGYLPINVAKTGLLIQLSNALYIAWENFTQNPVIDTQLFSDYDFLYHKAFSATDVQTEKSNYGVGLGINPQGNYQLQTTLGVVSLSSQQHIGDII